jgi:hypothetical protein
MKSEAKLNQSALHNVNRFMPDSTSLRYILFLIDSKIKQHDGKVFSSYDEAREYASDCIREKYSDKAVIGMFCLDPGAKEMLITMVETIGFAGDKRNVHQLQLFR